MKKSKTTVSLRLPTSVKVEAARRAESDGTSLNQFIATAVAEKLAAMSTASFFLERRERANYTDFDKLMRRKSGAKPEAKDQIP